MTKKRNKGTAFWGRRGKGRQIERKKMKEQQD